MRRTKRVVIDKEWKFARSELVIGSAVQWNAEIQHDKDQILLIGFGNFGR